MYEKCVLQHLIEYRLLNKLYNTEQVSKAKIYNCGSQKEDNFFTTGKTSWNIFLTSLKKS